MSTTAHSRMRAQQRCIPRIVARWLDEFGEEEFEGHGIVRVYFSRKSKRAMEAAFGRHFVRQNAKYLHAYRVESSHSGEVITEGWRTRRLNRH